MTMTSPRERQIIFNGDEVRAVLNGDKTQVRMPIKPQPEGQLDIDDIRGWVEMGLIFMPCQVGDLLYVREGYRVGEWNEGVPLFIEYRDGVTKKTDDHYREGWLNGTTHWKSPATMPKGYARIWLRVTDVRVERLNKIRIMGVTAEGFTKGYGFIPMDNFIEAWNTRYAKKGFPWKSNPWVWVIEFERKDE